MGRRPKGSVAALICPLFMLYNFFVAVMYRGIVTSVMTAKGEPPGVKSLDDLLKPEFSSIKWEYISY